MPSFVNNFAVQHVLQGPSGMPKDRSVNTFHLGAGDTVPDLSAVATSIRAFYNSGGAGPFVEHYLANSWLRAGHTIKIYNMAAPLHSPPQYSVTLPRITTEDDSKGGLPQEVAGCLSYKGSLSTVDPAGTDTATSRPIERRSGRIFIGPLNIDVLLPSGASEFGSQPNPAFNLTLRLAGKALFTDLAGQGIAWCIYSKRNHVDGQPPYMSPITQFSTDDAFDTQRRRGVAATARTVLSAT
jgi:hypothetical protein